MSSTKLSRSLEWTSLRSSHYKRNPHIWVCFARREFILLMIFRAGPNFMLIVVIKWSSFSSINAWPSISCEWNSSAKSTQPGTDLIKSLTSITDQLPGSTGRPGGSSSLSSGKGMLSDSLTSGEMVVFEEDVEWDSSDVVVEGGPSSRSSDW